MRLLAGLALCGVAFLGLAAAAPARSETISSVAGVVRVNVSDQGGAVQAIAIPKGKSAIVELPIEVRDVLVSDPKVADAVLRSPRRIYVLGVATGQTDAVFFDAAGRRILSLNIRVDLDYSAVAQTIGRVVPGASVHVEGINNSLVLTGQVADLAQADRAVQVAQQFTTRPDQVINMLTIAGREQVMLKVRIVEMQRSLVKQLGFNLSALMGQIGGPQYLLNAAATYGVNGSLLGGLTGGYSLDTTQQPELQVPCATGLSSGSCSAVVRAGNIPNVLGTYTNTSATNTVVFQPPLGGPPVQVPPGGTINFPVRPANANTATLSPTAGSSRLNKANSTIQAFESVGLVRVLAEPNLTAVSGESAKFLAGGEFPVPTGEDTTGKVSIEFKPFGVGLGFTPVVLSNGRISLKLSTEVSELSQQGAFTLSAGTSTSLTVPSLVVRRAETSVELPSGGGMMIAGLLQEESKQDIDKVPGVADLPVLGSLFRSRDYQSGETELVVIVTPYLVNATNPANLQTPADGFQLANDMETDLLGRMNKTYHAPPQADAAASAHAYQGPVGYVIE